LLRVVLQIPLVPIAAIGHGILPEHPQHLQGEAGFATRPPPRHPSRRAYLLDDPISG
jgi:hypothetical protein